MGVALTIIGYCVVILAAGFMKAQLAKSHAFLSGLGAAVAAIAVLLVVNVVSYFMTKTSASAHEITAEIVAKEVHELEENKPYPLTLGAPKDNPGEELSFTFDPEHPFTTEYIPGEERKLLLRVSHEGRSLELELRGEVVQTTAGQGSVKPDFETPYHGKRGSNPGTSVFGKQTLVEEGPCELHFAVVVRCEIEREYRSDFSKEIRSTTLLEFLNQTLTYVKISVPPDAYRAIKTG